MLSAYARICPWVRNRGAAIYAGLIMEQIEHRAASAKPLTVALRGRDNSTAILGTNRITFSGHPSLITRREVQNILQGEPPPTHISIAKKDQYIEINVAPPPETAERILRLKSSYAAERDWIAAEEITQPPEQRFEPTRVGERLRDLSCKVLKQAVEIAEGKSRARFGSVKDKFAVLIVAGSARGPELDSDLDYLLVHQGKKTSYFRYFAEQLEEILFQCEIDGDNLLARFSNGKIRALQIDDLDSYYLIFRLAIGAIAIDSFNDPETVDLFQARAALSYENTRKLRTHNSWSDIFYANRARAESTTRAVSNPSLETRKLNTALDLLKTKRGLVTTPVANTRDLLERLAGHSLLGNFTMDEILEAQQFFRRLKNTLWHLYHGTAQYYINTDIPIAAQLLGYAEIGTESLMAEITRQKKLIEDFLGHAKEQNSFNPFWQRIYDSWRKFKVTMGKIWRFIKHGDLSVAFFSKRLPPLPKTTI